jgi:hypothetical protein
VPAAGLDLAGPAPTAGRPPPPLADPHLPGMAALFEAGGRDCIARFLAGGPWG